MRAGKVKFLAEEMDQQGPGIYFSATLGAVDRQRYWNFRRHSRPLDWVRVVVPACLRILRLAQAGWQIKFELLMREGLKEHQPGNRSHEGLHPNPINDSR